MNIAKGFVSKQSGFPERVEKLTTDYRSISDWLSIASSMTTSLCENQRQRNSNCAREAHVQRLTFTKEVHRMRLSTDTAFTPTLRAYNCLL